MSKLFCCFLMFEYVKLTGDDGAFLELSLDAGVIRSRGII
jgi:hypothetical protein